MDELTRKIRVCNDGPCFVATAVYGDPNAAEVTALRQFRDNVLMESRLGRAFVDAYYSGIGRTTADVVKKHLPSLIPVIRVGLDQIVRTYQRK